MKIDTPYCLLVLLTIDSFLITSPNPKSLSEKTQIYFPIVLSEVCV